MSEIEKQVRGSIIILLKAIREMVTTVQSPSATLKEFDKAVGVLINQLSDRGPDVC